MTSSRNHTPRTFYNDHNIQILIIPLFKIQKHNQISYSIHHQKTIEETNKQKFAYKLQNPSTLTNFTISFINDKKKIGKGKTDIAANEATHSRKEVPKAKPPSLAAWLINLFAAIFNSLKSEFSNAAVSSSVFMAK